MIDSWSIAGVGLGGLSVRPALGSASAVKKTNMALVNM